MSVYKHTVRWFSDNQHVSEVQRNGTTVELIDTTSCPTDADRELLIDARQRATARRCAAQSQVIYRTTTRKVRP